jgi:D-lyxose ketol-isomerase
VAGNIFVGRVPRFPAIEEDAPRRHSLYTEYS